jgi:3-methyladenine DNA glycosylase AlkD
MDMRAAFTARRDTTYARWIEAYMRHQFPFLGLKSHVRHLVQKPFLPHLEKKMVHILWSEPEREFQYTALDLLLETGFEANDLPLLQELITSRSWWDTVDTLATKHCGLFFRAFPDSQKTVFTWLTHENLWLRRSALLFQLRYKEATDETLLFNSCRRCASDPNPFIQRAIGWTLREYSKTAPRRVKSFLQHEQRRLSCLTIREASQYLQKKQLCKGFVTT